MSEQQQLAGEERKRKLRKQAISFLLQLTKCLNTCKREVYTLSPNFVRSNINKLREAVDNALYVAEGIKELKISSTSTLKCLTQSAATLSGLMHISDNMRSTSTRSPYHCLLRVRRMLNLAVRVSEELHTYTWKMDPPAYWKPSLEVPFFLKPTTLVYDSSLYRDLLISNLKKQLECSSAVQMVEVSPGKDCDFVETCRSLRDTLDAEEKPLNLVVSLPLSKISKQQNPSGKRADSLESIANNTSFLEYLSKGEKLIPPQHQSHQQSSKSCLTSISKEARKVSFDACRSKRIATMIKDNSEDSDYDSDTDDSDDSSNDSDSKAEYSDGDSDDPADEDIDGEYNGLILNATQTSLMIIYVVFVSGSSQGSYEQQQSVVRKKKLQQQTASFLVQLTKCLNTCKKEVYTLSPNLVRPNINKLKEAVDNALYAAEGVKRLTTTSTSNLKRLTQTTTTVARLVHIRDSMYSGPAVKSSYHCLLRIRRFLNLAMRVAAVLHDYTEKMVSGEYKTPANEKIVVKVTEQCQPNERVSGKEEDTSSGNRKGEDMELDENSQLQTEEVDSPAYWKPSLEVPFFLKPATLVYDSTLHRDLLIYNLKRQLECSPSTFQMVNDSPGKYCDFVETCRSLRDTLDTEQKPLKLVVSLPLVKIPSSKSANKKSDPASVIPALHTQAAKLKESESHCQLVLDDVVDVGVVKGRKVSPQGPDYDAGIGEMINDFLWKVRREVVEKQSSSAVRYRAMASTGVLKGVQKQSTFKSSCKNRFSPYSSHSITAKG